MSETPTLGVSPKKKSQLATLSLIFSCCSIVTPLFLGSIAGIVCGHMAMREFQRNPELEGKKKARWGLIIGYVSIPAIIVLAYLALFFWGHGR